MRRGGPFGEHVVDDAHAVRLGGAHLHDGSGLGGTRAVLPQDGREALGRQHGVHRVLLHGDAVRNGERERTARAALAQKHAYDRNLHARHGEQVVCDGVALPALFCLHAAERALRVDEAHDGAPELLGLAHEAQALAVPLRLRATEIALDAVLQIAALFLGDHRDRLVADPANARDDRAVVAEPAIAVELDEPVDNTIDVVARRGPVHIARELHAFPCARGLRARSSLRIGSGLGGRGSRGGRARGDLLVRDVARMRVGGGAAAVGLALELLRLAPEPAEDGLGERQGKRVVFPIVTQQPLVDGEQAVRHLVVGVGAVLEVRLHRIVRDDHALLARDRLALHARRVMEREQLRERRAQIGARYNGVDEPVRERELGGLKALGELLLDGVANHALAREADERMGLREDDVALHGERRGDAARRRVGDDRDVGQAALS